MTAEKGKINKMGVVIGRFQTPELTHAHKALLVHAWEKNDRLLIFIGTSSVKNTLKNPLSVEARLMMLEYFMRGLMNTQNKTYELHIIPDYKSDKKWSDHLDNRIINDYFQITGNDLDHPLPEIVLYGGRDSFIKYYSGNFKTEALSFGIDEVTATEDRKYCHENVYNDQQWRRGVIHASAQRYPVSYQTVDIAVIRNNPDNKILEILIARKKYENRYRFIGGFVDPADQTLEDAARREMKEECNNINTGFMHYLGSTRIDDWRYRSEQDKIMTTLFYTWYKSGEIEPTDDIEELRWVNPEVMGTLGIEPEHHVLWNILLTHWDNMKISIINEKKIISYGD